MSPREKPLGETRKVTAHIPASLHAKLRVASLWTGKSLLVLMQEGLELIATHYRAQRQAARREEEDA